MKNEKSKIVFGAPHSFGWVRCSSFDARGSKGWERPDGATVRLPPGAQLARIYAGPVWPPIFIRQES
jgi:hypothetical protein